MFCLQSISAGKHLQIAAYLTSHSHLFPLPVCWLFLNPLCYGEQQQPPGCNLPSKNGKFLQLLGLCNHAINFSFRLQVGYSTKTSFPLHGLSATQDNCDWFKDTFTKKKDTVELLLTSVVWYSGNIWKESGKKRFNLNTFVKQTFALNYSNSHVYICHV